MSELWKKLSGPALAATIFSTPAAAQLLLPQRLIDQLLSERTVILYDLHNYTCNYTLQNSQNSDETVNVVVGFGYDGVAVDPGKKKARILMRGDVVFEFKKTGTIIGRLTLPAASGDATTPQVISALRVEQALRAQCENQAAAGEALISRENDTYVPQREFKQRDPWVEARKNAPTR